MQKSSRYENPPHKAAQRAAKAAQVIPEQHQSWQMPET
jgi:hypothetical protein